jgi:ribosomal protein S18 acetylase RimI-like enzyme
MLTIRSVEIADIPLLSEFWYDNMALLQQSNPRVLLLPDARRHWETTMLEIIRTDDVIFLVAENESELSGCIIGRITPNQPGFAPQFIGVIDYLILNLHSQRQQGAGRELLQAMKTRFIEQHITQLQVTVAAQATVAQAFWLGMGAKKTDELFWMTL